MAKAKDKITVASGTGAAKAQTGDTPGAGSSAVSSGWAGNLKLRLLTGIPFLILVLSVIGLAPTWAVALLAIPAAIYAMFEYQEMISTERRAAFGREPGLIGAALIGLGALFFGLPGMAMALFGGMVVITARLWMREEAESEESIVLAALVGFGLLLIPWSVGHFILIHQLPGGAGMLAMLVVVLVLNDTFAYFVGSLFGSRPLMPKISPKKTVEGSIAGLVGGMVGSLITWVWLLGFSHAPNLLESLMLGGSLAAAGQMGDLLESKLKRLAGVSDSGSLLPGHGGLLDRVDAFLFAAPVLYFYLVITGPGA